MTEAKKVWLAMDSHTGAVEAVIHDPRNAGVYKDDLEEWTIEGKYQESLSEVWIAFEDYVPYDEDDDTAPSVLGVFSSKQEADKKHPDAGGIEVYDLDDNAQVVWKDQAPVGKARWHVSINRNSKKVNAFPDNTAFEETQRHCWAGLSSLYCWASSKEEAIQIGWAKVREYEFLKWARG